MNAFAALAGLSLEDEDEILSPDKGESSSGKKKKGSRRSARKKSHTSQAAGGDSSSVVLAEGAGGGGVGTRDGEEMKAPSGRRRLDKPLVWVDLEMTGLDPINDTIMEIAVIVTDGHVAKEFEGPEIAIHHPDEVLAGMNEWCVEQHGKSGLTARCQGSNISLSEAESLVLEFVSLHTEPRRSPIAGNTVHMDLAFLRVHMPRLAAHLHYRIVDVSSIKELCWRWFPDEARNAPQKVMAHTALSDIRESIKELQYFRRHVFKQR